MSHQSWTRWGAASWEPDHPEMPAVPFHCPGPGRKGGTARLLGLFLEHVQVVTAVSLQRCWERGRILQCKPFNSSPPTAGDNKVHAHLSCMFMSDILTADVFGQPGSPSGPFASKCNLIVAVKNKKQSPILSVWILEQCDFKAYFIIDAKMLNDAKCLLFSLWPPVTSSTFCLCAVNKPQTLLNSNNRKQKG